MMRPTAVTVALVGLVAAGMIFAIVPASAAQECCVCADNCPSPGTRVCFNVQTAPDCEAACETVGCNVAPTCTAGGCTGISSCDETGSVRCGDGLDNNDNGLIDCQEPTCLGEAVCHPAAPALSHVPLAGLGVLLVGGGIWLTRKRTRAAP